MYKKLTEEYEEQLFQNYNLTDLMLLKKKDRKIKSNENSALYILLRQKLEEYGLSLFGQFERNDLTFRGVRMLDDFPIENEPILKQLYGYIDFTTHIQLRSVTHRINFNTLSEMLEHLKVNDYENAFTETV